MALALVANLDGDQAALHTHYERALALAEAAGDVVQAIRIRTNLAVALEREARYADALAVLTPAVTAADRIGHTAILALGLGNQASLPSQLGRLDEAVATYERCVAAYQKIGSRKVSYPLFGARHPVSAAGRTSQALAAFEEAARIAAEDENRLGLIPALAGLARTLAAEDPDRATGHAARRWSSRPARCSVRRARARLGWRSPPAISPPPSTGPRTRPRPPGHTATPAASPRPWNCAARPAPTPARPARRTA